MADWDDVRRIALALPGVTVGSYWGDEGAYLFPGRGGRGLVGRRPPRRDEGTVDPATDEPWTDLLVVYTATPEARDEALAAFPEGVVFTIPHFKRSNAVLAHLDRITPADLEDLLEAATRPE